MSENLKTEQMPTNEASLIAVKRVLTFDEACIYTGFAKSYLYKLTS